MALKDLWENHLEDFLYIITVFKTWPTRPGEDGRPTVAAARCSTAQRAVKRTRFTRERSRRHQFAFLEQVRHSGAACNKWPRRERVGVIFPSLPASGLLVAVFPPDVEPAAGFCSHSHTRALIRPNSDVGWWGLGWQSLFQFIPNVPDGPEVQGSVHTSQDLPQNWEKRFCVEPALCKGAFSFWNRKETNTNCWSKVQDAI